MKKKSGNIWEYSQPAFYRFSEDSVLLAKIASSIVLKDFEYLNKSEISVLDLCAGSGIVGMQFLESINGYIKLHGINFRVKKIVFCEIQNDFNQHFEKNLDAMPDSIKGNTEFLFINDDFRNLHFQINSEKFDIVLSNPPYFNSSEGQKSKDNKRDICRRFIYGDMKSFFDSAVGSLGINGSFIFTSRSSVSSMKKLQFINDKTDSLLLLAKLGNTNIFLYRTQFNAQGTCHTFYESFHSSKLKTLKV